MEHSPFIRELDDSHVGHVLANGSIFCLSETSASLYSEDMFCTVKPRLHDSTVTGQEQVGRNFS